MNPRIVGAVLFGTVLVAGSFWLSNKMQLIPYGKIQAIGEKINPNEQLPDIDLSEYINPNWREDLYGNASSTYTLPNTLTGRYAINLLQGIMLSNISGGDNTSVNEIVDQSFRELEQAAADQPFTLADISTTKDISMGTLKSYGNQVMQITINYESPFEAVGNDLDILEEAWDSGVEEDLEPLDVHIEYMEHVLADTKALTVPIIYQGTHLTLLNGYQAHLNDLKAMRAAFTDPLFTMARLRSYNANLEAIYNAYTTLYNQMYLNGVRWHEGDIAKRFVVEGGSN